MLISENVDKAKRLHDLVPYNTTLSDGSAAIVTAMTDHQLTETFNLIQEAAHTGSGFGVNEYGSEKEFREDVSDGCKFAVLSGETGEMVAAFLLVHSKYSRGCTVADPFIIVKPSQRGKRIGALCLQLCVEFAQDLLFMGMYVDTFCNNHAMIRIIETAGGFREVGCLPMGGRMKDGSIVGSIIFYKDLNP